jgi:peroxiredoxin Q/BCP
MVDVGEPAPEFTLTAGDGSTISLSDYRDKKWVVLHLFPAAFTGG